MEKPHPNLKLLQRLDIRNIDACESVFSDGFTFHYFNPNLPELEGDYVGASGLKRFFKTLAERTSGSFEVHPISATPVGDELLVVQTQNSLTLDGRAIAIDVVVVWRIVDGKFTEAWDIPSAYTLAFESTESASN